MHGDSISGVSKAHSLQRCTRSRRLQAQQHTCKQADSISTCISSRAEQMLLLCVTASCRTAAAVFHKCSATARTLRHIYAA
jgi:hypothetical protein